MPFMLVGAKGCDFSTKNQFFPFIQMLCFVVNNLQIWSYFATKLGCSKLFHLHSSHVKSQSWFKSYECKKFTIKKNIPEEPTPIGRPKLVETQILGGIDNVLNFKLFSISCKGAESISILLVIGIRQESKCQSLPCVPMIQTDEFKLASI